MIFASDNWSGASDKVIAALAEAARRGGPAYSGDPLTKSVERQFAAIFEREVSVFFVGTGTAANALALSAYARPGGVVFCHREAHSNVDEAGAVGLFGGGLKLHLLDGDGARISAETLDRALALYPEGNVHHGLPVAVTLGDLTELGQTYAPQEIAAIAGVAHRRGLAVHIDGARFGNAVAALGVAPAELTWKAGVDAMSFGGTKNGCLAAEAVVFFNPEHARYFGLARQRAGHGFAKAWFIAAQFAAYLEAGHWLDLARHANAAATRLAAAIRASGEARLAIEPHANEIFAIFSASLDRRLKTAGAVYHPWPAESLAAKAHPGEDEGLFRLLTSFRTSEEETAAFAAILSREVRV